MIRLVAALLTAALLAACTSAPPAPTPTPVPSVAATPTEAVSPVPSQTPSDQPSAPSASPPASSPASPSPSATGFESELALPGILTACVSIVGSPAAGLTEDGQLDGYNVAFANELAARLGLQVDIQQPLFEDLIDHITGHTCDISVSSQNITSARSEQVSFVPYTRSRQPVLVEVGNPEGIFALEDLCGLPVSTTTGTTHVDLVEGVGDYVGQGLNDLCQTAGGQSIDLHTFDTELEAVTALLDGEVIAYLGNPSFIFDFPDQIVYSGASLPPASQGIAIALDHPNLLAAIEGALNAMVADGVYRGILVQYLPNEASVDVVTIED